MSQSVSWGTGKIECVFLSCSCFFFMAGVHLESQFQNMAGYYNILGCDRLINTIPPVISDGSDRSQVIIF